MQSRYKSKKRRQTGQRSQGQGTQAPYIPNPLYQNKKRKANPGCLAVGIVGIVIVGLAILLYKSESQEHPTSTPRPLVMTSSGQGEAMAQVTLIPTMTLPPTSTPTPEPNYKSTQHAQALIDLSNLATLESSLAITESAFRMVIAYEDATATQSAENLLNQWQKEQATQEAETAASIAINRKAQAQAQEDEALANLAHAKAMNQIAEKDEEIRLAKKLQRDQVVAWSLVGMGIVFPSILFAVFVYHLVKNLGTADKPKKEVQAIIRPQATDYKSMMSEQDYYRLVKTLKAAVYQQDEHGNYPFRNSTKMPHFSQLSGVSSEIRSSAAHILEELNLVSIHDNKTSNPGTYYANHMTNEDMYDLLLGEKDETPPPPLKTKPQRMESHADHAYPISTQ